MKTRHPASQRFHDLLKEIGDLHDRKQADYGRTDDPFANVRASTEWGMPGWVGAMMRANDKVRRLQVLATRGTLANEGARDSFLDIAVYALIAAVLHEEETSTTVEQWGPSFVPTYQPEAIFPLPTETPSPDSPTTQRNWYGVANAELGKIEAQGWWRRNE